MNYMKQQEDYMHMNSKISKLRKESDFYLHNMS
jgi:hypothetical protein